MLGPTTWTTNKVPAILVDWAKTATILPRSSWLHVDGALTTAGPSLLRLSGPETKGFISTRCSTKKKLTTKLYLLRADTDREKLLKFGKKKIFPSMSVFSGMGGYRELSIRQPAFPHLLEWFSVYETEECERNKVWAHCSYPSGQSMCVCPNKTTAVYLRCCPKFCKFHIKYRRKTHILYQISFQIIYEFCSADIIFKYVPLIIKSNDI